MRFALIREWQNIKVTLLLLLIYNDAFQNLHLEASLLNFVGQVHRGVKGVVFMPDGTPAKYAEIGKV